jgi:hypothetical protein
MPITEGGIDGGNPCLRMRRQAERQRAMAAIENTRLGGSRRVVGDWATRRKRADKADAESLTASPLLERLPAF